MALIFADAGEAGVGNYLYEEVTTSGSHGAGFEGSFGIATSGVGALWVRKTFSTTYTEIFVSIWPKITSNGDSRILTWWTSATELGSVRWASADKHLKIYTGASTTSHRSGYNSRCDIGR